jgi:ABC-type transport system substrate-binding protein
MATTGGSAAAADVIDTNATAKVAIYDTFSGWCFANNLANSALMAGRTIYETLFEKTPTGDLAGLLAVSGEPVEGSGLKTWKVTLREGIKFHDGTPFNADSVVDNWNYGSAGDGTDSKTYFGAIVKEYVKLALAGVGKTETIEANETKKITADQAAAYNKAYAKELASKDPLRTAPAAVGLVATFSAAGAAVDVASKSYMVSTAVAFGSNILAAVKSGEYEVTYLLDRAQNDFLGTTYASGRSFQRAPSQFTEGSDKCLSTPIGTGPFKVSGKWTTNKLTVVRNDSYWRKDAAGKALPYLKKITFENVKETAQRANAVIRGTYDAAMFGSGDGKFNKSLRKNKAVKEIQSPTEYYPSLWLNQGKPGSPFANKNARLAVMTCLDRANFFKVRTASEGAIAKSLVGSKSIMYSTKGFSDKLQLTKSKEFLDAYKKDTGKKELRFTIPSDTSSTSVANIDFLAAQWKKCGIKAVRKTSEAADIIAKTFNASPDKDAGEYYNAYDAIIILLMEGSDATFNMPFVLTNAYSTGTPDATKVWKGRDGVDNKAGAGRPFGYDLKAQYVSIGKTQPSYVYGADYLYAIKAKLFGASLGQVLSLNHHPDTKVDDLFYAAAAAPATEAKAKYAQATEYLQASGTMTSLVHGYYNMFYNVKNGLQGFTKLTLPGAADKTAGMSNTGTTKQRAISNWGVDWTGVYKNKK